MKNIRTACLVAAAVCMASQSNALEASALGDDAAKESVGAVSNHVAVLAAVMTSATQINKDYLAYVSGTVGPINNWTGSGWPWAKKGLAEFSAFVDGSAGPIQDWTGSGWPWTKANISNFNTRLASMEHCGSVSQFWDGTNCVASSTASTGPLVYPNNGPSAYGWFTVNTFTCPTGKVMAGIQVTTAGTCTSKCNGDGPIIRSIQLVCR